MAKCAASLVKQLQICLLQISDKVDKMWFFGVVSTVLMMMMVMVVVVVVVVVVVAQVVVVE